MRVKTGINSAYGLGALVRELRFRQRNLLFCKAVEKSLEEPDANVQCQFCDGSVSVVWRNAVILPCGHYGTREKALESIRKNGTCPSLGCSQTNLLDDNMKPVQEL